jgi:hypothetical protein
MEVLGKRLGILSRLAPLAEGFYIVRMAARGAVQLERRGLDFELVGAEGQVCIGLACEVVGEGAGGQLCGRADRPRGTALLGGQTRRRGAVGALAAVQDLREESAARQ